jgi:PhnB protein
MRFMVIRRADKSTEAGGRPSKALLDAMMKYHEDGAKAGIVLDGTGLQPSSKGARVKIAGGKATVTDGPFAETKELIAGFTMIQAKSREEAIAWVKGWPREDGDVELEIRQLFEPEDVASWGKD